jgi:anti-sigma B factor antagonist
VSGESDHDHSFLVATASSREAYVLSVSGQADLHTAPELREAIGTAIDEGNHRLAIDLTEATFVDSMTLGVLLGALRRLSAVDGRLVIICPDPHLRRVFEITSLDRVLDLANTRDEAVDRLSAGVDTA